MKRIAAPMIGGIFMSFLLELLIYPAIYELWRWNLNGEVSLANAQTPAIGVPEMVRVGEELIYGPRHGN